MNRLKMTVIVIVAILLLIAILQNTESVETKLLFVTVTMPRAVLLLSMLIIGYVLGIVTWAVQQRRAVRAKAEAGK